MRSEAFCSAPAQLPSPAASATSLPSAGLEEELNNGDGGRIPSLLLEAPMKMASAPEELYDGHERTSAEEGMIQVQFRRAFERFGEIRSFRRIPVSESWQLSHQPYPHHPPSPTSLGMAFVLEYWDTRALAVAKNALDGASMMMQTLVSPPPSASHAPPLSLPRNVNFRGFGPTSESKDACLPVEIEVRLGVVFAPQAHIVAGDASGAPVWENEGDYDEDDGEDSGNGNRSPIATRSSVVAPAPSNTSNLKANASLPSSLLEAAASPSAVGGSTASGASASPSKTATTTRSTPPLTRRSSTGSASLPGELTGLQQQMKALSSSYIGGSEADGEWVTGGNEEKKGAGNGDGNGVFDFSATTRELVNPISLSPQETLRSVSLDVEVSDGDKPSNDDAPENKRDGRTSVAERLPAIRRTSSALGCRAPMNQSLTAPSTPRKEAAALLDEEAGGLLFSSASAGAFPPHEATPGATEASASQEAEKCAVIAQPLSHDDTPACPTAAPPLQQQPWLPATALPTVSMNPYPMSYSPESFPQHPQLPPHHVHTHTHAYHHPMQFHPHQYAIDSASLAYYPAPAHPQTPVDHHHLVPPLPPPSAMQHVPPYPMFTSTSPVAGLPPARFYATPPHPNHQQQQPFHFPPHFQQPNAAGAVQPYGFPLPPPPLPGSQDGSTLPSPMDHHYTAVQQYAPLLNPTVEAFSPGSSNPVTMPNPVSPGVHFKPPRASPSSPTNTKGTMGIDATSPPSPVVPKSSGSGAGGRSAARSGGASAVPASSNRPHAPVLLGHNNPRWRGNAPHSGILRTSRIHHMSSSANVAAGSRNRPPGSSTTMHVPHHTALGDPIRSLDGGAGGSNRGQYGPRFGWSAGGAGVAVGGRKPTPEANIVDVDRIEQGLDTRTTVMLKNVPNKVSSFLARLSKPSRKFY